GILLLGDAAACAADLRQIGYTRISTAGCDEDGSRADSRGLLEELRQLADGEFEVSAAISLLPRLPAAALSAVLDEIARVTRRWVAAVLPVYPQALERAPHFGRLERAEWWEGQFKAVGFAPVAVPHDPLAAARGMLYERRRTTKEKAPHPLTPSPSR